MKGRMRDIVRGTFFGLVAIFTILLVLGTGANAITVSNVTNKTPMATTVWILWNVSTEANNNVEYSINSDLSDASFSSWNNNTSTPEIKLWNLQTNTTYYYRVWSYNTTNESDYVNSSIYNFTTQECVTYKMVNATDTSITGIDHPIQEAIDSLCPEGGVVELALGVHDVYDTIVINKSNVTIQGTHDSEIRSHDPNKDIFVIPHENPSPDEPWDTMPVLENIVFKGFKVTSTYDHRGTNHLISAWNVKNITMEDVLDESYVRHSISIDSTGGMTSAWSENIYVKNNILYNVVGGFCWSENIYIINNTIIDYQNPFAALDLNRNAYNIYVIGNYIPDGANANVNIHNSGQVYFYNNIFAGNAQYCLWFNGGGGSYSIVENNTIRGATIAGIGIHPQSNTKGVVIRNNRIYNNKIGIKTSRYSAGFTGYDSGADIINNVIYNNAGDGIQMTCEYVNLSIKNNIIANNSGYGINYMDTVNPTIITYNDVWNNSLGNYNNTSLGTGDISKDPLFADPANYDFHLKSTAGRWNGTGWVNDTKTSPCIDAGDPNSSYSNETYPHGQKINIGAYGNTSEASKSPYHKIYLSVPMTIYSNGEYSYPEPPITYKDNQTVNITFNVTDTTNLTINSYTSSQISFTATNTSTDQKMNITVFNGTFIVVNGKKYEIKKDGTVQQTKTASDNKVVFTDIPVGSDYVITEESGGKEHKLPVARPVVVTGIAILIVVAYWRYRRRRRRMRSGELIVLVPGITGE